MRPLNQRMLEEPTLQTSPGPRGPTTGAPTRVAVLEEPTPAPEGAPEEPSATLKPQVRSAYFKGPREPRVKPPLEGRHEAHLPAKARVERKQRMVVAKALSSGEELPLHVTLETMRWAVGRARTGEKLLAGAETREGMAEVVELRELAQAAAQAAAPYLHAKLARILQKGDKGVQGTLVIEDA